MTIEERTVTRDGIAAATKLKVTSNYVIDLASSNDSVSITRNVTKCQEVPADAPYRDDSENNRELVGITNTIVRDAHRLDYEQSSVSPHVLWSTDHLVLPESPIGIGARWILHGSHEGEYGEITTFDVTYTLVGFDAKTITVEIDNNPIQIDPQQQAHSFTDSGTIIYDRRFGIPIGGVMNSESDMFGSQSSDTTTYTLVP